jgi:hypothetical protein
MLDLCRKVDPNISEAAKLSHMWRGLKPSLTEKLWSLKPASCDEFLREVRRYQEMTMRARQEDSQTKYFVLNTSFTRHSKTGQCHFNSS